MHFMKAVNMFNGEYYHILEVRHADHSCGVEIESGHGAMLIHIHCHCAEDSLILQACQTPAAATINSLHIIIATTTLMLISEQHDSLSYSVHGVQYY